MKETTEQRNFRIESEIGRNVADYIFNKAKEKAQNMSPLFGELKGAYMAAIRLKDLQEICNQPPPIEKEKREAEAIPEIKLQPPGYQSEREMQQFYKGYSAGQAELVEKLKEFSKEILAKSPVKPDTPIGSTVFAWWNGSESAVSGIIGFAESLLKQNSEGKESK